MTHDDGWTDAPALLTDLYQLTMVTAYQALGMERIASFEFFVRQLYLGLLQRDAEPGGINAFTQALRGGKSRAETVDSLLRSPEFQQRMR